jgi:aryl-alcohol dehydrogenase-like predicted oxidoreductase
MSYQVQAVKAAAELLSACRDNGCNFFDNAEVYAKGAAEALIGKAIKVRRRRAPGKTQAGF